MEKSLNHSQYSTFSEEINNPLLQSVLESLPDSYVLLDLNLNYVAFNTKHAFEIKELYGVAVNVGLYMLDYMTDKEERKNIEICLAKVLEGKSVKITGYLGNPMLARRHFEISHTPFLSSTAKVIGICIVAKDITEQRLTEEKVELSEKRFRALVENVQDMVSIFNAENLLIYTSPAVERITGFTLEEFQQMTRPVFIHPDEIESTIRVRMESIANPGVPILSKSRLLHKDGHCIWVEGTVTNLLNDNCVNGIVTNYKDVTERKLAEEKLTQSEAKFRAVAEISPIAIYSSSGKDQKAVYINESFYKIFGYSLEDVPTVGHWWLKAYPDETYRQQVIDQWTYNIEQAEKNNTDVEALDCICTCKDGSEKNITWVGKTINDEFWAFGYDLTERRKVEEALFENQKLLQEITDNSTSLIYALDTEGKFTLINKSLESILGIKREDFIGKKREDFMPMEIAKMHHVNDQKVIETMQSITIEEENIESDGIHAYLSVKFPLIDKDGKLGGVSGISTDITERRKAEIKLFESEKKLSALFSSMTEMVVIHELVFNVEHKAVDYIILDCNQMFTDITGIKKEDAVGKLGSEVYSITPPPYLDIYNEVALTGKSHEFSAHYAPLDKHFIISVVSPSKNQFATITSDITAIKQFQLEITDKNKELESYLYIASHDLRSPLVNIQGFSLRLQKQSNELKSIAKQLELDQELREKLDKLTDVDVPRTLNFILSNVTKMDSLINSLLQISRTGRLALDVTKLNVNKLLNKVIATYNFEITENNVQLIINNLPPCYGDENQLNQVFSNIIGNAIKYRSVNRLLTISIKATQTLNNVIYCISDNGIGIGERHLNKIWDVFYRVDASALEAGEGIGLSIAKTIVGKHKGRIWVESEEGVGSIFYIELQKNAFSVH